jgi:hypothetical protein
MEFCAQHGIPHSVFLGWKIDDQDKALAWMLYERSRCPRCGTFPEEWLDEDGRNVEPPPYYLRTRACLGCATLEPIEDRLRKDKRDRHTSAYLSTLPPTPTSDEDWGEYDADLFDDTPELDL